MGRVVLAVPEVRGRRPPPILTVPRRVVLGVVVELRLALGRVRILCRRGEGAVVALILEIVLRIGMVRRRPP